MFWYHLVYYRPVYLNLSMYLIYTIYLQFINVPKQCKKNAQLSVLRLCFCKMIYS